MCGVIAYISKDKTKDAGEHILNQYQDQFSRGQKGFGLISVKPNEIEVQRSTIESKAILDLYNSKDAIQVFHHRLPTSTDNKMKQTHPFFIEHDELGHDYCVIHNGVIRNVDKLFKEHTEELGYIYKTLEKENSYGYAYNKFNDSEALAIEVARFFNGSDTKINAIGTIAFIAIQLEKETKRPLHMMWSRNTGNPLECLDKENGFLLASSIDDVNAELITHNTFEMFDLTKYFKSKAKSYDVYDNIDTGKVEYEVAPPAPIASTTPRAGFGNQPYSTTASKASTSNALPAAKTTSAEELEDDDMLEDIDSGYYNGTMSKRDQAFNKMAERVVDNMAEHVHEFFANLAYAEVNDDEITNIADELFQNLLERAETARNKVRPYFDRIDEEELDRLVSEDAYHNISDAVDESEQRFQDIIF